MAFIVPTFNLVCNVWRRATWPTPRGLVIPPPDLVDVPCQLRPGAKNLSPTGSLADTLLSEELCVAAGTDLRVPKFDSGEYAAWPDICEVPSGSSRWYLIVGVADVGKGFTNEYRVALLNATTFLEGAHLSGNAHYPYAPPWPVPYP